MEVDLSEVRHRIPVPAATGTSGTTQAPVSSVATSPSAITATVIFSSPSGEISAPASVGAVENPRGSTPGHGISARGGGGEVGGEEGDCGGGSVPWLHVVGLEVLEACAAKTLYLPYLSLSAPETLPQTPSPSSTASTVSTGSLVAPTSRGSVGNAPPTPLADTRSTAGASTALHPAPPLPAGSGSMVKEMRGGAGCNVVLNNALVGVEVCFHYLVLDSRLNRRNKKQVGETTYICIYI